ncbi:MAG: acyl carrier protein [Bacteroidaceae bacterium]|nr:acyl carrier protein [Bacteroidaceae bacterium]
MNNLEKYNNAFIEVFGVEDSALGSNFNKDSVDGWDSVHQLNIIALLEESFDIMLDPEDIMELTSYEKGKELMVKYEVEL